MSMTKEIRDEAPQRSLKALGKIYRDFFQRTGDLMMLHDLEGRLIHVNPAVSRLSGYTFEELIGRPIDVFILPKFRNLFREAYLKEIHAHGYAEGVVLFQAKDGSAYYVDYRNVLVEEPGFEPYVSGLGRDITARKQVEAALQENQERYRALANASFEAIFISDKGICIDANQTAADMFGYDNGELIGVFGTDVIAPESKALVKQHMLSGYEEPYEAVAQRKDGTHFRVEIRGKMTEYRGRPVRVTVVHDIDQTKEMESRLRDSERKYREMFELSPEAIVLLDRSGTVLDVNDRAHEWLAYDREAIIGRRFWDFPFLSDDDKAKVRKKFLQRMAGEQVPPYEIGFNAKPGAKRVGRIVATAIRDAKGEVLQDLVMISDITDRILAEQALQKREAELGQRSRDLAEVNAALRVLLKKRESDKSDLEEQVLLNVKELINPYLQKLKQTRTSSLQRAYLKVLEENLNEIVSPFYRTLSTTYSLLTPKEMQVADLVRQGRTTKEIAALTNSTPRAVEFHRNNTRKKLGLTNQKTNLRSYLLTLN